jgi:anthranilate synthase component 1
MGEARLSESLDPFKELEKLVLRYRPVRIEGLPRFCGGAVGYIGYDMVRFFERLPEIARDEGEFPDCAFMLADTLIVFDHVKHKMLIISNAFVEDDPDRAYDEAVERIESVISRLKSPLPYVKLLEGRPRMLEIGEDLSINSNFSREEFVRAVKRVKDYIAAGDAIQVVLSQRLSFPMKVDPFRFYRALRMVNPSPYMYFLRFGDLQLVGASPEMMVRVEGNLAQTRPIAGTRRRGGTPQEDRELERELLDDPKERAEHVMLVDLGRNDLGRVCEFGTVRVTELMVVERYSHVMHIVSNVVGRLRKDKNAFDVIRACFPAGTLSGAPKVRAMEIIEELEPVRRGPYGGAVGYFSFYGDADTAITIRTLVAKNGVGYVQAGAGIVADSVPEKEHEECLNKAKALLRALTLAESDFI